MSIAKVRCWTREEYDKMVEMGIFAPGGRVELIDGEVVEMVARKSGHATAVRLVEDALRIAFGPGYDVRVQMPIALDSLSEPEPDVTVVRGSPRDYRDAHPITGLLVVEVAEATIPFDGQQKGSLYARAGVADYWIVNLVDRRLEVRRDPAPMPQAHYGWGYRTVQHSTAEASVSPLAAPQARVSVADLLP